MAVWPSRLYVRASDVARTIGKVKIPHGRPRQNATEHDRANLVEANRWMVIIVSPSVAFFSMAKHIEGKVSEELEAPEVSEGVRRVPEWNSPDAYQPPKKGGRKRGRFGVMIHHVLPRCSGSPCCLHRAVTKRPRVLIRSALE